MRNIFKKWIFFTGLAAILALFFLVWGCFIPSGQRTPVDWEMSSNAEKIYDYLVLEQSLRSGSVEEVKRSVRFLIDMDPSEETYVDAISSLMFKGEKKMALEIAEKGYRLFPVSKRIVLLYVEILMQSAQTQQGVEVLSAYIKKNPDETGLTMRLAELLIKLREYGKANEILNLVPREAKPTDMDPAFPEEDTPVRKTSYYLYTKGRVLAGLGKTRDAEAMLRRAVEKDPEFIEAWAELALLYEKNKRPAEALEIYKTLLEMDRENPSIWVRIVHAELQLGHVEKAYSTVELGPPSISFLMQAAQLFMASKQWDFAEQIYLKAAALPGVDDEVFLYLFLITYDGRHDVEKALQYLNMVRPESPIYERAEIYKIQVLTENKRFDEAVAVADDAISKYPGQRSFWQSKAALYALQGKYDEADRVLSEALQQFPNDAELMFARGALYDQSGRKEEAMLVMEEILKQHPDDSAALNYIGYTLADKGVELERARKLIVKALEGDPENAHIIDSLAWVQYRLGDFEEAYKNILRAIGYEPEEPEIWEHYGDIAKAVNKNKQAKDAYRRALELNPGNSEEIRKKMNEI